MQNSLRMRHFFFVLALALSFGAVSAQDTSTVSDFQTFEIIDNNKIFTTIHFDRALDSLSAFDSAEANRFDFVRATEVDGTIYFEEDIQLVVDSINAILGASSGDDTSDEFQSCGDSLTYNNYKYPTVEIGNDCWFAENLRTETDSDGATIPSGLSNTDWENATEPAFTILDEGGANEEANLEAYGLLYNWYAVTEGLCPSGWHVATADEYQAIIDANGGSTVAGEAMKASDTDDPTWNGTNTTGFDAVAGGRRQPDGSFGTLNAFIWTSNNGGDNATHLRLKHYTNDADIIQKSKAQGMSVRCAQDTD